MATLLAWYDSSFDSITAEQSVQGLPGVEGTPLELVLINNKNGTGADELVDGRIKLLFDDGGSLVESGTEWSDRQYVEARIKGSGNWNGLVTQTTEWTRLGTGRMMDIPNLANDKGINLQFRLNAPPDVLADAETFQIRIVDSPGEATSQGLEETYPGGIYAGINDASYSSIVTTEDVVESGSPDRNANVQDTIWIAGGKVYSLIGQTVNIPNAASSMERYDLLSCDAAGSGTVTRTAGSEVASVTLDDVPATPAGDVAIAYVFAGDSGAQVDVEDIHITNIWTEAYFSYREVSGLQITLAPGINAVVDNSMLYRSGMSQVTLTDDETNTLWLNRDGSISITTDESNPGDRSLPLWEIVAASGSITGSVDLRTWSGLRPYLLRFDWLGVVTDDDYMYSHIPNLRGSWIFPIKGIYASIGAQQSGASGGQFEFDIEVEYTSGVWTTIFGSGSVLPQIAYDATGFLVDNGAFPTRFDIPRNARVRAKVDSSNLTGVSTNPADASLTILVAL